LPSEPPPREFPWNMAPLFVSAGAAFDSVQTLASNFFGEDNSAHISARGYWVPPKVFRTSFGQQAFFNGIAEIHERIPQLSLKPVAFAWLARIVEICRRNDARLYLLITPNYPWDDYRLLSLGYWPLLEDWLRRISRYPNVISFSQYNEILEEKPAPIMRYW